jgi:hypothetical protein
MKNALQIQQQIDVALDNYVLACEQAAARDRMARIALLRLSHLKAKLRRELRRPRG